LDALRARRLGFGGAQEYQSCLLVPGGKSGFVCFGFLSGVIAKILGEILFLYVF
jgi:hypothetical protein